MFRDTLFSRPILVLTAGLAVGCGSRQPATYDVPPVLANREEVTAALRAMGSGLEAQVVLAVHVNAEGEVREVRVAKSSGDEDLDDAARWVGERMRFEPAQHRGRPVSAWVQVPVTFDVVSPGDRNARLRNSEQLAAVMAREHSDLEGTARLRVHVNAEGRVTDTRQGQADSAEMLRVAERLARSMEFWPARRGFEPIDSWVTCVFEFDGPQSRIRVESRSSSG